MSVVWNCLHLCPCLLNLARQSSVLSIDLLLELLPPSLHAICSLVSIHQSFAERTGIIRDDYAGRSEAIDTQSSPLLPIPVRGQKHLLHPDSRFVGFEHHSSSMSLVVSLYWILLFRLMIIRMSIHKRPPVKPCSPGRFMRAIIILVRADGGAAVCAEKS